MFSTPNELEMHPGTLKPVREKPTREEALSHYIHFVLDLDLRINTDENVIAVNGNINEGLVIKTNLREKPTREEALSHYIHFVLDLDLRINTDENVIAVNGNINEGFVIKTNLRE